MARDPNRGGAFVFDLVDDGEADLDAPRTGPGPGTGDEPDGDPSDVGEKPPSGGATRILRSLAPVGAVLAIALGTGLTFDGLRDGARMERMRDVHGGVADVSSPLTETWAWEGAVGSRRAVTEGLGAEVAVLGGVLVFESAGELVGLDPATGAEAWVVPLGADPDCGPMGSAGWGEATTQDLVCLTGPGADRSATVVEPDGTVSPARALDGADTRRYGVARPGPDGTVLRAERTGQAPVASRGDAECNDLGECVGTVEAGRDLVLRAEDAVTGEERWRVTIPFRPTRAEQCANWYGTSWDGSGTMVNLEDMLDPGALGARITGDLIQLYGCGVEAVITPDGAPVGSEIEPGDGSVSSLRTGGYVGHMFDDDVVSTVLYGPDGDTVGAIDGYASEPGVVDGSGPGTLLGIGGPGPRQQAYESDGVLRWDVELESHAQMFLAQVAGTAVVLTGSGAVRGLDLVTGAERWAWEGMDQDDESLRGFYVARSFTDGQSVLLLTENGYGRAGLVALDVASGQVTWEQQDDEGPLDSSGAETSTALVAVDGNLLRVASDGVRGLG